MRREGLAFIVKGLLVETWFAFTLETKVAHDFYDYRDDGTRKTKKNNSGLSEINDSYWCEDGSADLA